ncbi:helix-turn-helix transcriptional regulator [uncultured Pelagimonas sp.]|uniref:helix-turn-helix domain-containing protein n=1 Tax=uncultured Pelagimonas sp. TaxID=1618102 RepID=UPI002623EB5D|nr:helix-turn-helix transcriptional regulator [uncultured Pelagimonas sp.]
MKTALIERIIITSKLSDVLAERNLSQSELARRIGVHPSVVNRACNDKRGMNMRMQAAIAVTLQCQPSDLFSYTVKGS